MRVSYARQYAGAILWLLSIQYYVSQFVVAAAWPKRNGYSWARNTISDLANTHCGLYGTRTVCSPLHDAMNLSFIILGLTILGGAVVLRMQLAGSRVCDFGFGCMAIAGVGTILVGIFPENTISGMHILGAGLSFVLGNLGMIVLGIVFKRTPVLLRSYTILSGIIGLIALVFFMTHTYLGIGIGGMERFVDYPQSIWMIVFGAYIVLRVVPKRRRSNI